MPRTAGLILLFLVTLTYASSDSLRSTIRKVHEERFAQWMAMHNKVYPTQTEYNKRLNNFIVSTKIVAQKNIHSRQINSTATFGLNKFADLSAAEFSALLGMKNFKPKHEKTVRVAPKSKAAPPTSWDWRGKGITGQKNELQCGSCWAMTVAMAIESAYIIHKGQSVDVNLSTQQIVDCDTNDNGCNGGEPTTAYQYVVSAGGLETNEEYPYNGQTGTCKAVKKLEIDPITGYQLVIPDGSTDEITMANFLATNQPISTAVDASSWQYYTGGVLMASQCTQNIDHGVQIVGYKGLTSTGYWVIRNMWGSDWGEDGFIRLQFGENTCGLTCLPTAPTL